MTLEEKQIAVARYVAQAGWSAIYDLVCKLDESDLDDYPCTWDDEDEEEDEEDKEDLFF